MLAFPPATVLLSAAALLVAAWVVWLAPPAAGRPSRRPSARLLVDRTRLVLLVICVHALLVGALFAEAIVQGWTLAAPRLLDTTWPWAAYDLTPPPRPPNPMTIDLALQFGPWLEHIRGRLAEGTLPLWNPLSGAGEPFVALYQSAVFSPFTWVGALVPPPYGLLAIGVLQLLGGGLGMFVLLRALGLGWAAALIGSTAWLFNSFTVGWLGWPFASVACLFPWLVWAVHRTLVRPDRVRFVLLAGLSGLVLLAGHPETAAKIGLVVSAFALAGLAARPADRWPALRLLAGAVVAGVLLAAVQIGPFVEHLPETGKLAQRQETVNASYTPRKSAIGAWVPDFFGPPEGPWYRTINREGTPTNYLAQLVYPGVATWLLAAVGVAACWRRWPVIALAAAGALAAGFKYGAPGLVELVRRLPTPLPYFSVDIVFCAVVLGAYGVHALWRHDEEPADGRGRMPPHAPDRPAAWPAVLVALGAVAAIGLSLGHEREVLQQLAIWRGTLQASGTALLLLAAATVIVLARQRRWIGPTAFAVSIAAVLIVDLVGFARGYQRLAPPPPEASLLPEIAAIRRDPGLFRVVGLDDTLPPNALLPTGLPAVRTYDGVGGPRRFNAIIDRALDVRAEVPNQPASRAPNDALLDVLNVAYVVGPPDLALPAPRYERVAAGAAALYRNTAVLPRAWLADRYVVEPDDEAAAEVLARGQIDIRRAVVLADEIPRADRPEPGRLEADHVEIRRYDDRLVEVAVVSARPRLLLLADLFAPGWSATVDGVRVPLVRANVAFRAVPVPAGTHTVRFRYAPRAFLVGAWLSSLTALALLGAAVWPYLPRWRRRRR